MNAILAKKSRLLFYRSIPLYTESEPGKYVLYKPATLTLSEMRLKRGLHPTLLYLDDADKLQGIQDVQHGFNYQLRKIITRSDPQEIRAILIEVIEETFSEPRTGSLEGLIETVEILIDHYQGKGNAVQSIARVPCKNYTTAIHSINVMAFTLAYCFRHEHPLDRTRALGLSALLHDVGKTTLPEEILSAPRKLTDLEFHVMKLHPQQSASMLMECAFTDDEIVQSALEHHEKIDGAGYPSGSTKISFAGQLVSLIDCYDAITCDNRPYRDAAQPLDALTLLKREVQARKYDLKLFEKFAYSLT